MVDNCSLAFSNIEDYVLYDMVTENGRAGCRSKDFLDENEQYVSFARLFQLHRGMELTQQLMLLSGIKERIDYTVESLSTPD